MNKIAEKILSLPKSIYVSFRLLPFRQAIQIPILCRFNTKILDTSGLITLKKKGGVKTGLFQIGFGTVGIFDKKYERSILQIAGTIELDGKAYFGHGSRICVMKSGKLTIGENFSNSAAMTIICGKRIELGKNVLTSWNTLVMDTDFHPMYDIENDVVRPHEKEIEIGDNVWLCTRSVVLKGSKIADGCIIGANSLVSGRFNTSNTVIAGNPAKEIRHNITLDRNESGKELHLNKNA